MRRDNRRRIVDAITVRAQRRLDWRRVRLEVRATLLHNREALGHDRPRRGPRGCSDCRRRRQSAANLATGHAPFTARATVLAGLQGLSERMMGLEPTTFAMASGSWVRPFRRTRTIRKRLRGFGSRAPSSRKSRPAGSSQNPYRIARVSVRRLEEQRRRQRGSAHVRAAAGNRRPAHAPHGGGRAAGRPFGERDRRDRRRRPRGGRRLRTRGVVPRPSTRRRAYGVVDA